MEPPMFQLATIDHCLDPTLRGKKTNKQQKQQQKKKTEKKGNREQRRTSGSLHSKTNLLPALLANTFENYTM